MTQNPTHEKIYCALVGLHALVRVRQYYVNEDREPITKTSQRFFPTLLELAQTLDKDLNPVNAMLAKEIAKIYFRTIRIDLDDYLREVAVNDGWMDTFFSLFKKSFQALSAMHSAKVDETTYQTSPYWNIIKWVTRSLKRYSVRYGDPDKENSKYETFAAHWMNKYSGVYWDTLSEVLNNRKAIKVPEKITIVVISIMVNLIDCDVVMSKPEAQLESMLLDTMLDILKFTKDEEMLFYDNPVEYFRKNDENNPNFGTSGQALNFFGKTFKRKKYLKAFMKFVNECLSSKINPRTKQPVTVIDIESFFHVIETHSIYVTKIKDFHNALSGLLANYVLPELVSEHGFMRMRACKMISSYASSTLEVDLLKQLSDGVIKCLADKDLPVRSCAAQAFEVLLVKKELRDHFLPNLKELLQVYVKLINEFENDTLISSLQGIFKMYSEVIGPYALELISNLKDLFFKCLDKEKKAQDCDDDNSERDKEVMESGFACQGCINSIEEILRSNVDKSILPEAYNLVEPIFQYAFSDDGLDFLSEVAGILNMLVYNLPEVPQAFWSYFVIICYSMLGKPKDKAPDFPDYITPKIKEIFNNMPADDFACEFVGDMSSILRNFVSKGNPILLTGVDFYGVPYLELLTTVIISSLKKNLPFEYTQPEIADMLSMPGFILSQHPGKLDSWIGRFLEISKEALSTKFNQIVKDGFIHNLGYSLWNNTTLTLETLSTQGHLASVLQMWPEQHRRSSIYRIRKASFIGMMSLFSLSVEILQKAGIPIIEIYKVMMNDLPKMAKEQERMINAEFEDSEDEDLLSDEHSDDLVDLNEDKDDDENDLQKKKAHKKKADATINQIQKKLETMSEGDKLDLEEAREAYSEIEDKIFNDNADNINEILVFETTLTNLHTSNPPLMAELEKATTPEMRTTFVEVLAKVKKMIDDR